MPELKEPLSEREQEILRLVATGAANKDIARQLVISPNTVKVHLRNIFTKIGVTSRTEATLYAMQTGLIKAGAVQAGPEETEPNGSSVLPALQAAPQHTNESVSLPEDRPRFSSNAWRLALLAVFVLLLVGAWVAGTRMLAAPTALLTAATNTGTPTQAFSRWIKNAPLPEPRKGMGSAVYENVFFLIGGETDQGIDGAVLRYNLAGKNWQTLASKPTPVTDVQAALMGEKIFVPGGCLANGSATNQLEVYDPRQNTWESRAALPAPRCAYSLAAFEGQLYLFGGKDENRTFASVFVYDPQEDQWNERSPMSSPRAYAGAVVTAGKIHIIGGIDGTRALDLHQAYLPTRDGSGEKPWEDYAPLPEPRYAMGITQLVSMIYLLGGVGEEGQPVENGPLLYNIQLGQWMAYDSPPVEVSALPALLAYGNMIYLFGGETSAGLSTASQSYEAIYTIAVPILRNDE